MTTAPSDPAIALLADGVGRIRDLVGGVLEGLPEAALVHRPDPEANTIAWLVWHLTRVQDNHLAEAAGEEEVWTVNGWAERFGLPFDRSATGYGQTPEEVGQVRAGVGLLRGYHDAVCARTLALFDGLSGADLDRVVDEGWDPPVTLGVRLVSVLVDDLEHVGQAAYLRGLYERSTGGEG